MKARLHLNQLTIGSVARDFIKLVKGARSSPAKETDAPKKAGVTEILESFQDNDKNPNEIDLGIMNGEFLNRRLDHELTQFKVIPYFFSHAARSKGEGLREGDSVYLLGDDRLFMLFSSRMNPKVFESGMIATMNSSSLGIWFNLGQKRSSRDEA